LEAVRAVPGVAVANPFLISAEGAPLRYAATGDLLLALKDRGQLDSLLGEDVQYLTNRFDSDILRYPDTTSEFLNRKATVLSLDERVIYAEPDFIGEVVGTGADRNLALPRTLVNLQASNCARELVSLQLANPNSGRRQVVFSHSSAQLIIFETAQAATGPWTLLTNVVAAPAGLLNLPNASAAGSNLFLRAIAL
jgi:hypothetical protein